MNGCIFGPPLDKKKFCNITYKMTYCKIQLNVTHYMSIVLCTDM